MVKRFWRSGRSGIYLAIVEEGELEAAMWWSRFPPIPTGSSVADVVRLFKRESDDSDLFERAMRAPLYGSWKREIRERWA